MAYLYPTEKQDVEFFNFLSHEWQKTNFFAKLFLWPLFLIFVFGSNDYKKPLLKQAYLYVVIFTFVWFIFMVYLIAIALAAISAYYNLPLDIVITSFFGLSLIYLFVLVINNIVNITAVVVCMSKTIYYIHQDSKSKLQ